MFQFSPPLSWFGKHKIFNFRLSQWPEVKPQLHNTAVFTIYFTLDDFFKNKLDGVSKNWFAATPKTDHILWNSPWTPCSRTSPASDHFLPSTSTCIEMPCSGVLVLRITETRFVHMFSSSGTSSLRWGDAKLRSQDKCLSTAASRGSRVKWPLSFLQVCVHCMPSLLPLRGFLVLFL